MEARSHSSSRGSLSYSTSQRIEYRTVQHTLYDFDVSQRCYAGLPSTAGSSKRHAHPPLSSATSGVVEPSPRLMVWYVRPLLYWPLGSSEKMRTYSTVAGTGPYEYSTSRRQVVTYNLRLVSHEYSTVLAQDNMRTRQLSLSVHRTQSCAVLSSKGRPSNCCTSYLVRRTSPCGLVSLGLCGGRSPVTFARPEDTTAYTAL